MFKIICVIVLVYIVRNVCDSLEAMAKDYEEKRNDGWIDYRSNEGFRA